MGRPWSVTAARRKEAAIACDMMASSNDRENVGPVNDIEHNVSGKPPMIALAKAAFAAVFEFDRAQNGGATTSYQSLREAWAEAAQALRDGYTPGGTLYAFDRTPIVEVSSGDSSVEYDNEQPETMIDVVGHNDGFLDEILSVIDWDNCTVVETESTVATFEGSLLNAPIGQPVEGNENTDDYSDAYTSDGQTFDTSDE